MVAHSTCRKENQMLQTNYNTKTLTKECHFKTTAASWLHLNTCATDVYESLVDWFPLTHQTSWLSLLLTGCYCHQEPECLCSEHFCLLPLAWLGLIKAFCWNKVIIHLAISQFPHNYPPASRTTNTRGHTRTHTHSHRRSDTNTFSLWFVSLLRGEWLKGFRVGLLVTA